MATTTRWAETAPPSLRDSEKGAPGATASTSPWRNSTPWARHQLVRASTTSPARSLWGKTRSPRSVLRGTPSPSKKAMVSCGVKP